MRTCDVRYRVYAPARGALPPGPWRRRGEAGWLPPPECVGLPPELAARLPRLDAAREVVRRVARPADFAFLREALATALALARPAGGLTLDVHGQRYYTVPELERLVQAREVNLADHLVVHRTGADAAVALHTHGLAKFGLPDLNLPRLREDQIQLGAGLLLDVATAAVQGLVLDVGDILDVGPGYLRVVRALGPAEDGEALYGRLDLHTHDVITGADLPDLTDFLEALRRAEASAFLS